jgi:hypothetical protein
MATTRQITVVNTPKRTEIKVDKQAGIFNNGADNAYPQLIERIINGSVSARTASDMLKKFLIGNGFAQDGINSTIIYKNFMGEVTLYDLLSQVCGSIAKHRGAYLQVQWNMNGKISSLKHLPYRDCRLGKSDSNNYSGLIHLYNNWDKQTGNFEKGKIRKIDVFNPIKEVIQKQMQDETWQGQIAYLYLDDEYVYPLATIDCVREDADTENQIGLFKNGELRRGFFAKYIMYHTIFENEQDEKEFKASIEGNIGGGHETSMILMPAEFNEDGTFKSESNVKLEKIEQNHNDKIFESFENSVKKNICKSHLGLPNFLVDSNDSSSFAQSGESFVQGFVFYNTQTKDWRTKISQFIAKIMKYHENAELANSNYEIAPLTYESTITKTF